MVTNDSPFPRGTPLPARPLLLTVLASALLAACAVGPD